MAKKKLTHEEALGLLDEQRRQALGNCDYAAYATLCDECGIIDDEAAYERGCADRRGLTPVHELMEDGLEGVVKQEEIVIDDKKFGDTVARSFERGVNSRQIGNLKTNKPKEYAAWIIGAFLDSTQRHKGYGVKVESSSGISSGRMRRVYMGALFHERLSGKERYMTEYSTGFDEDHDDMDKTDHNNYRNEQLELLKSLVSQTLPNAHVVIRGKSLYVFKKE